MTAASRNNVKRMGRGERTLVFAHGFGCDQSMWRAVAPDFAAEASVVLFDHVGAGGSDWAAYDPVKYDKLEGYAQDVTEICDELRLSNVTFVGHSVGATIGVLAAVERPDLFKSLVLVCPSPRYSNTDTYHGGFSEAELDELLALMAVNHMEWSTAMAPAVIGPDHGEVQSEWSRSVCSMDPAVANQFARVTFKSDHRASYRRLTTPALIIDCTNDSLGPPEVGAWIEDVVPGSRRVTLKAHGHCPHMTTPEAVTRAVRGFLGSVPRVAVAA